jgi:hypothetical protein
VRSGGLDSILGNCRDRRFTMIRIVGQDVSASYHKLLAPLPDELAKQPIRVRHWTFRETVESCEIRARLST